MLPVTVSHGNSADSWNMSPVRPSTVAVPRDGRSRPARMLSNVLFPQPDAPSRHTNSPFPTVSVTSSSAWTAFEASP